MKPVSINLNPEYDSDNSDPPDVSFYIDHEQITVHLNSPPRRIIFDAETLTKILAFANK